MVAHGLPERVVVRQKSCQRIPLGVNLLFLKIKIDSRNELNLQFIEENVSLRRVKHERTILLPRPAAWAEPSKMLPMEMRDVRSIETPPTPHENKCAMLNVYEN